MAISTDINTIAWDIKEILSNYLIYTYKYETKKCTSKTAEESVV